MCIGRIINGEYKLITNGGSKFIDRIIAASRRAAFEANKKINRKKTLPPMYIGHQII